MGPERFGDLDGDSLPDTLATLRLAKVGSIPAGCILLNPDSAGKGLGSEPWGLNIATGKARYFIPSIPSVIYDQGGAEIASIDTLPYPDLRKSADPQVRSVISLYTQAGINIYLYFKAGRFQVYWPDEEP
jgi:hypothetical protein